MSSRRVLLLLKPLDIYPTRRTNTVSALLSRSTNNGQILDYLDNRNRVHKDAIDFCKDVLQRKSLDWQPVLRNTLSQPIRHVDLVITIGGDGTLLQASHFMDDSIPIVGVNSDPTQAKEVEEKSNEFDATRSTGYLCAATTRNFEQVLDEILGDRNPPSELSRILISINGQPLPTYALNDILVAHPCPATVSRFSFLMKRNGQESSALVNFRSSGLRVCTAAGSTAAMLSAGGFRMPILSRELQYMVREPILPSSADSHSMHGLVRFNESMHAIWTCKEGIIYIDGSNVCHMIQHGDIFEISSKGPMLKVFLPSHLL